MDKAEDAARLMCVSMGHDPDARVCRTPMRFFEIDTPSGPVVVDEPTCWRPLWKHFSNMALDLIEAGVRFPDAEPDLFAGLEAKADA